MHKSHACLTAIFAAILSACSAFVEYPPAEQQPASADRTAAQERPLAEPANRNYFVLEAGDQEVIGELQIVLSREQDTFSDLAREYGLGYDELVDANPGIDPWLPGEGTPVLLPTQFILPDVPRRGIVLNIASKRLFYFPEPQSGHPNIVMTFPIGIGRVGWETPLGEAAVIAKARDPRWYVPASVRQEHLAAGDPLPAVVEAGPDNPLGRYVLKLDLPGYLIHGTNQPYGVGMRVSHGCVRLYPENIELLYSMVDTGTPVRIVNQPYLAGRRDGELYFEFHPQLEDDPSSGEQRLDELFVRLGPGAIGGKRERDMARSHSSEALGVPLRVLRGDVGEIYERASHVRNTVEHDEGAATFAELPAGELPEGVASE